MSNDRIRSAFATAGDYAASCLAMRQPVGGQGSRFLTEMTLEEVMAADWQPYEHPAVQAPAKAFKAPIAGRFGLVRINELPTGTVITLKDPKGTGFCEAYVSAELGQEVDFTVLLLGPTRQDPTVETLWTFFPGLPVMPSRLPAADNNGRELTAAEATQLGLEWAKAE